MRHPERLGELMFYEVSPETSHGTVIGVGRQEWGAVEGLVDILGDDEGLTDGPFAVEEHGHFLVDGVELEQQLAHGAQEVF
uniref:Uncharacterized protein n=1 Tax=Arundo donax TaxID=35708 RepID=A0A0A9BA05_ARUDO